MQHTLQVDVIQNFRAEVLLVWTVVDPGGGWVGCIPHRHPQCTETGHLRSKIEKHFWGGAQPPSPCPLWEGGTPSHTLPLGCDHIPLHQRFLDPSLGVNEKGLNRAGGELVQRAIDDWTMCKSIEKDLRRSDTSTSLPTRSTVGEPNVVSSEQHIVERKCRAETVARHCRHELM